MSKVAIVAGWDDVPHLDEDAKSSLLKSYKPHERDARTRGSPSHGAGAIYPVPVGEITIEPFKIPKFWPRVFALDVGWKRTAAIWGAWDREEDVVYLYSEYYRGEAEPAVHAQAIRSRGRWIPGVIDPAARGRSQRDGDALIDLYVDLGLSLGAADNAVEAGIYQVWERLSAGRMKVFSNLQNFFAEYRIYRRDEKGKVIKENDHLMDCARYLCMTGLQIAEVEPPSGRWEDEVGDTTRSETTGY